MTDREEVRRKYAEAIAQANKEYDSHYFLFGSCNEATIQAKKKHTEAMTQARKNFEEDWNELRRHQAHRQSE